MRRVSKRFKSLVSLLLLCGCLASFSSGNAFAATDHDYFDGYTVTSTDTTNGVKSVISVSSDKPYVEYEGLTGIGASESYAWYKGYVDDFYTVSITNTNDYPVISQFPFVSIAATTNSPDTLTGSFSWYGDDGYSITLSEFNNCSVFTISELSVGSGYSGVNNIEIYPNADRIDDLFLIQPHDTLTFSFKSTRCYNVSYDDITGSLFDAEVAIRNALQYANITNVSLNYSPTQRHYGGDMSPQFNLDSNNTKATLRSFFLGGKEVGILAFRYHNPNTFNLNTVNVDNRFLYTGNVSIPASITFLNNSESDLAIDIRSLNVVYPKLTLGFYDNLYSTINYELIDVETDGISTDYWQDVVRFYISPEDLIDGCLIVPAGERYVYEVNFVYKFNFIRDKYNVLNGSDFNFDVGALTLDYACSVPSNDALSREEAAINNQTQQQQQQHEEQMQQQQQQHEEQMQQQQEQYDDFTSDGATEGESFITGTDSAVKEKIGIFTFLDSMLENLLGLFDAPEGDAVITFPAFSMEVGGETHQIWGDTQFNLSSLDDDFAVLLTAVRFGTVATVYFALINFLGDTYSRIFGGKSE